MPKKRKSLERATQAKSNQNNHGHAYLPPFGIIEKGLGRANKINQGVCNHHHLGNGGKKRQQPAIHLSIGTLMILAIRVTHKQVIAQASTTIKQKNQNEI